MLCRCLAARWGESVCRILRQGMCTASQWLFVVYHTEEAYSNCQAGVSCASCLRMLGVPNHARLLASPCTSTLLHRFILCVCMRKTIRNTSHKTRMINRAHAVILQAVRYTACQYNATTPLQIGLSPYFTPPELGHRCAFIRL